MLDNLPSKLIGMFGRDFAFRCEGLKSELDS